MSEEDPTVANVCPAGGKHEPDFEVAITVAPSLTSTGIKATKWDCIDLQIYVCRKCGSLFAMNDDDLPEADRYPDSRR